ncbi:hypothetical protein CEXT_176561 [Caerostris extrusa]|uniref:Uncharacterized protein n=1 Tax=Caerostris extrusa TaxID=172846 RepID=A0AAV4NDG8_CAEEX|nr:hypothetical protein CEXT_176561 [Caerostris extrusa]
MESVTIDCDSSECCWRNRDSIDKSLPMSCKKQCNCGVKGSRSKYCSGCPLLQIRDVFQLILMIELMVQSDS